MGTKNKHNADWLLYLIRKYCPCEVDFESLVINRGASSGCSYIKIYSNSLEELKLIEENLRYSDSYVERDFWTLLNENERSNYVKSFGKYSLMLSAQPCYE